MNNIEDYKTKLTNISAEIVENFEKTGEDDMTYLGKIASGKISGATLPNLFQRAQVFSNASFRGRVGVVKSFTSMGIPVVKGANDGTLKGLFNNRFTSYVVADKTLGLSDLKETHTSVQFYHFFRQNVGVDISNFEEKLTEIASTIQIPIKKLFSKEKYVPYEIVKKESPNSLCVLMDEVYQIAEKSNSATFDTELEKVTSSILATWLVSRAMNLSIDGEEEHVNEIKLDEAMKLQFYNHLNGCYNNGNCAISNIVKSGTNLAIDLIEKMGLDKNDVKEKCERLGRTLKEEPQTLSDALFGAKKINDMLKTISDDEIMVTDNSFNNVIDDAIVIDTAKIDDQRNKIKKSVNQTIVTPPPTPRVLIGDGTKTVRVKSTEGVAELSKIAQNGETIAKVNEKVVPQSATIVKIGEVAHKKGNAVNYGTLKKNLLNTIIDKLNQKSLYFLNRAAKNKNFDDLDESNFWAGASDGVAGYARQKGKTAAYYAGHTQGQSFGRGLVQGIDNIYSPDKKTLDVSVSGKGAQVTKKLGDLIVQSFGVATFSEFVEKVVSNLSNAYEKFKANSSSTQNTPNP